MRVKFWNALALAAGFLTASVLVAPAFGQEARAAAEPRDASTPAAKAKENDAEKEKGRTIELKLAISGLGRDGCEIDVKPGNPACVFKPQTIKVSAAQGLKGELRVTLDDVRVRSADRNCAIALTIREEGQPARTVYRGYRVLAQPKPGKPETFACYMNAPSRAAAIAAAPASPEPARR